MSDINNGENVAVPEEQVAITLEAYFAFKGYDTVGKATRTYLAENKGIARTWRTYDQWEEDFKG